MAVAAFGLLVYGASRAAEPVTVAGVAASLPAAATGALDLAALPDGHRATDRATRHMMLMLAAVGAFVVNLVIRAGAAEPLGVARIFAPECGVIGLLLLTLGGWYGGELVFREGPREARRRARRLGPGERRGAAGFRTRRHARTLAAMNATGCPRCAAERRGMPEAPEGLRRRP